MARQQSGIGLSETQLRERLNKLQELHILPEHRAHPSLQDPDRPGEVSAGLIKDLFKALGIDGMLANRPVAGKHSMVTPWHHRKFEEHQQADNKKLTITIL